MGTRSGRRAADGTLPKATPVALSQNDCKTVKWAHEGMMKATEEVKAKLVDFDRASLHQGEDMLKPYKATIDRWLWPDVLKNQDTSVAKAKKAIADYKKASGTADGLAELMVFCCEQATGFSADLTLDDEGYLTALVRMSGQALNAIAALPPEQRGALRARLDDVRSDCDGRGYGVGEDMDALLAEHGGDD
jgi:hypothetical protein